MLNLRKHTLTILMLIVVLFFIGCTKKTTLGPSSDEAADKAQWYKDALSLFSTKYTKIKIIIVYHEKWQNDDGRWSDLRINSSSAALEAYKQGIANDYFIGKEGLSVQGGDIVIPETGCYTGFFPGWGEQESSVDLQQFIDFEALSGKSVAFSPFSVFWGDNYDLSTNLETISSYGAVPLVRLMPWGEPYWESGYQSDYALQKIIDGAFDTQILSWANEIKGFNKPVLVTFGVEMNGNWFPWSGVFQGGSTTTDFGDPTKADGPERYVAAFRHIVTLFRDNGTDNAIWYFQPNHESYPDEQWNSIDAYYPGDDYVDWVGVSVYGAQYADEEWVTFEEVMQPVYDELITKFSNKPLMIPEWGVMEP